MAKRSNQKAPAVSEPGAAACVEPRTPQILKWDPEKVVNARLRASYGDFSLFSDLCEAMMPDDRVSQALEKLYSATTLPLTFQLPGVDAKESEKDPIVQALQYDWWKILPEQALRAIVAWVSLANCALLHIDGWRKDDETGRVIPVISVWSLRHLRHDQALGLVVRAAVSGSDYYGTEEQITPGDGNWVVVLNGANWRAIAQARGHSIALFWLLKQFAIVDWASSSERHGQGTNVAESNGVDAAKLNDTHRRALAADMSGMARNGNLVMPPGWTYRLVTDTADSYKTFEAQIKAADSGTVIGLVGTNLTTEVSGGSYAAASAHLSVDAGRMRGLLEFLATGAREQIIVYWVLYNFASGVAPYPKWDTTPPTDKKAEAEARLADASALEKYLTAGAQLDQLAWFNEGRVALVEGASNAFPERDSKATVDTTGEEVVSAKLSLRPPRKARSRAKSLGVGDVVALAEPKQKPATAFAKGRAYVDELETNVCRHAAKGLAPTLAGVLSIIDKSNGYSDALDKLREFYANKAAPTELLKITESALIMAELAGRETVEIEFATEE